MLRLRYDVLRASLVISSISSVTYIEHVLHVVNRDEGIVDVDDLDLFLQLGGAHNQAADSSETIDSNFDC